jgi:nucleoid-associated protein YgaU
MKGEIIMNKLMARIVAVVLAVMMLGTVSFAATTATENAITTDVAERAMYTVKATKADGTFLAMYQDAEAPGTIDIDANKVNPGDIITVEYGGVENGYVKQEVQVSGEVEDVAVEVATEYFDEETNTKYTGAAVANKTFSANGKVVSKVGYKLTATGKDGYTGKVNDFSKTVSLSGDGKFTFGVVLLGVPVGVTVTAVPYIEY